MTDRKTIEITIVVANEEVLKRGVEEFHRKGSAAYRALKTIAEHGRRGATRAKLAEEGVPAKYLSRMLRTSDYVLVKKAKA